MPPIDGLGEGLVRLAIALTVLVVMAGLETVAPRRARTLPRARRWLTNLAMAGLASALLRLVAWLAAPLAAVTAASIAAHHGWGLLAFVEWPAALEVALAIVALDLAIYAQHVASHHVPLLWRVHRVHHADRDIDATTGIRFHPIEIVLSMLFKVALVVALGASPLAVVLFEIILNGCALFNHANVALPAGLDRALRALLVTPDMHRVHHSVRRDEQDSNFGFNLSVWDRLFGTYRPAPADGHEAMTIGLAEHQDGRPGELLWSLSLPAAAPGPGPETPGAPAAQKMRCGK